MQRYLQRDDWMGGRGRLVLINMNTKAA